MALYSLGPRWQIQPQRPRLGLVVFFFFFVFVFR